MLFGPELIIISAGFDAHSEDPLGGCYLTTEDFAWATIEVQKAAFDIKIRFDMPHRPPIISMLEGGYDLDAIAASAVAHCRVLSTEYIAPLAMSEPNAGTEVTSMVTRAEKKGDKLITIFNYE